MHSHGLTFLGLVAGTSAFGGRGINTAWRTKVHGPGRRSRDGSTMPLRTTTTRLDASPDIFLGDSSFVGVPGSLDGSSLPAELIASAAFGAAQTIAYDPRLESEIFADFSHVALDLMTFAAPAKAMLRLSAVIGRVAAIMADYVPDHTILPEEAAFQAVMLGVSTSLLFRTFRPMVSALLTSTSYRDRRAYHALFSRYGLSWMQFKILLSVAADWVEIEPDQVIESREGGSSSSDGDDFVYWLHKGEAELIVNESPVQRVIERKPGANKEGESQQEGSSIGILGELEFARKLQECKKQRTKKSSKSSKATTSKDQQEARHVVPNPTSKIKAGPSGATLLRINTAKLLKLMDDDEQLADSVRSIIFAGMEEKLTKMVRQRQSSVPLNATAI